MVLGALEQIARDVGAEEMGEVENEGEGAGTGKTCDRYRYRYRRDAEGTGVMKMKMKMKISDEGGTLREGVRRWIGEVR